MTVDRNWTEIAPTGHDMHDITEVVAGRDPGVGHLRTDYQSYDVTGQ